MDRHVKRIKREQADVVSGSPFPTTTTTTATNAENGGVTETKQSPGRPPATPQKACPVRVESAPSTPVVHRSDMAWPAKKRVSVNRRLIFDDEMAVSAKPSEEEQRAVNDGGNGPNEIPFVRSERGVESPRTGTPKKMAESRGTISTGEPPVLNGGNCFGAVVRSLSARGFAVQKLLKGSPYGDGQQPWSRGADDDGSSVYECVSLIEGNVYGVHVMTSRDKADGVRTAARALAAVGPHPHVVSYFSSWTDGRFHYMQLELCTDNLLSTVTDAQPPHCRKVLEHVSCALHYLHDFKKYAHNRVNRRNVYWSADNGDVVYKLAGFHGTTKLTAAASAVADVKSLCSAVLELLDERLPDGTSGVDDDVDPDLRSYLLCVAERTGTALRNGAGALNVWRWCCNIRRQTARQQRSAGPVMG